jgi:hypothetical protein
MYEFVYRGHLAEEAMDRVGRVRRRQSGDAQVAASLSLELLDADLVDDAQRMAVVYTAIAAFENGVRRFVKKIMLEERGVDWWETSVSEKIRVAALNRLKDEEQTKWHTQRGGSPIDYTLLANLLSIMQQNWESFEPHIRSVDWARSIFDALERSRNVIMHSGSLDLEDVARLGIYIRDWAKQVGS